MHAPPPGPHRPLLALIAGAVLLLVLGGSALVAASRGGGEPVAASQATGVPRTTPATTEALSGSRACERAAVRALSRYAQARTRGADPVLALGEEQARLSPLEYQAFTGVVNEMDVRMASGRQGLADVITSLMPQVRRVCRQAG